MRSISLLILLALSGAILAACGGSSNTNTATNAADSSVGGRQAEFLAFSQCMRSHGVPNFPDLTRGMQIRRTPESTTVNGVQINSPAFQSAMQACHSKLPNGGRPGPLSASQRQKALQFSQCMRAHGLTNFPDPTFSAGSVRIQLDHSSGLNPSSPAFQAAQKACGGIIGKGP